MRKIIAILCFLLGVSFSSIKAYAAENNIKMLIYLSGETIEKIEYSIDFSENAEPYCMFMIPCKVTEDNIVYDSRNIFFDFATYDNYTVCIVAPIKDIRTCKIQITNNHGEIYQGITLKGFIANGECEMKLTVPTMAKELKDTRYVCEYSTYSIIQNCPFSSLTYSEDGKRILTEEIPNTEIILDSGSKKNITYEYVMRNLNTEQSPQAFSVITVIAIPFLMTLLSIFFSEGEKEGKLRMRNKILYICILCSIVPVMKLCFASKLPVWVNVTMIILYLLCIIFCIANNFNRIKEVVIPAIKKIRKKR